MKLARMAMTIAGLAGICFWAGCYSPKIEEPKFDVQAVGDAAMQLYDADNDGRIGGKELKDSPGLREAVADLDTDGDRALSREEIVARIEKYAELRLALAPSACNVSMNNRPLEGATVRFVPVELLEGMIQQAQGVTDASGEATPTVDDPVAKAEGITGANPGFYRVEVSLVDSNGKETIPAKYNAETTLGIHIGHIFHGGATRFELTSR